MIEVLIGDILDSKAQTLVNTVNCVGIMGKGIALKFKSRFPSMYRDYAKRCRRGEVKLGHPSIYRELTPPWIINFPTKDHWRQVANLDAIIEGMEYLVEHYEEWGITSIAVPPLGCGEGQLEWRIVGPTMYRYLAKLDIPVEFYAPYGTPSIETQSSFLTQSSQPFIADALEGSHKVNPNWVAIVEILSRIEKEPYHRPVGRTMFQKIAYFATEEGLETDLEYAAGSYGPFAKSLKSHISKLVNNGLITEQRHGQMIVVKTGRTFDDAREAYRKVIAEKESVIDLVATLFLRMNTHQAELAATVHYAANQVARSSKRKPTENQVLDYVVQWKQKRRPPLSEKEIALTIRNLASLGWLKVKPSKELPIPDDIACIT